MTGEPVTKWKCIGCGTTTVSVRWTYCRRCRRRVDSGNPVDLDDYVTMKDFERLCVLIPGEPYSQDAGWKPHRHPTPGRAARRKPRWHRRRK